MALKDEISKETVKIKDMPFKKKVEYIWEYYKFHIIGTIAGIVLICVFIHDWQENRKPVYIDAAVINSDIAYYDDNPIRDDFIKYAQIDTSVYNLQIDTGFIISTDQNDSMSLVNTEKLMALFAAGDLDIVMGPDDIIDNFGGLNAYMDLTEVLTPELKKELEDNGYEMYYTTVYEEDDNGTQVPTETYLAGVYLDGSEYLKTVGGAGAFTTQIEAGRRPVFTLAHSAKNIDNALQFLRMLTGI